MRPITPTTRPRRRPHSLPAGALTLALALAAVSIAPPVGAEPLDRLSGTGLVGSAAVTETGESAPPAGGWSVEAESLAGGTTQSSTTASGGKFLRSAKTSVASGLDGGPHEIVVRAKAPAATRLRITVGGAPVGAYTLTSSWETVRSVAHLPTGAVIGVEAEALPGSTDPGTVDIDWIFVTDRGSALTTAGSTVVGLDGRRFTPKGITMPGYQAARSVDGRLDIAPSFAAEQHAWGFTMVRLPMNQEHWLADCPSTKHGRPLGYRAAVADEVSRLTSRGVVALLTLTRTERGVRTGCQPAGFPVFKEMADTRSVAFWRSVGAMFADNPMVAFDLFNEPHDITDGIWHDGGTVEYRTGGKLFGTTNTYEAVGMQDLYDAVRGAGADNVVFVSGQRWASDPRIHLSRPLDGFGIVSAVHTYCHGCSPGRMNDVSKLMITPEARTRYPLVISESGVADPTSSVHNREVIDFAKAHGLGWSMYAWGHPQAAYTILLNWVGSKYQPGVTVANFRPSWSGTPIWNELADVRVARGFEAGPLPESP